MPNMRAVQVSRAGGPLELVERPIPEPGPGTVRIKVEACGICHSDVLTKDGVWPGIQFPACRGTKPSARSTSSARTCRRVGRLASELVSAGMHGTAVIATLVGAATTMPAKRESR